MTSLRVAGFVAIALMQGPTAPSDSPAGAPQDAQARPAAVSAKQYLDNAKQTLSGVAEESLPNDARKVVSQLRSDFAALSSAYSTSDWMTRFYDVERDLALLIGGGAMLAPATASSLLSQQDVPDISLLGPKDPSLANRTVLERFRVQLELFYDATGREGRDAARGEVSEAARQSRSGS
jgi:hypothetical protein